MKKVFAIIMVAAAFAACESSGYTDKDVEVAMVAFNADPDKDQICEVLWLYDKEELKSSLMDAYDNGKPDGSLWTNVGISPTKNQVKALVDIEYDYCSRDD